MMLLLKVRLVEKPCERCGKPIEPGCLYVVGPPPTHVSCPSENSTRRRLMRKRGREWLEAQR